MIIAGAYLTADKAMTLTRQTISFSSLSELKQLVQSDSEQFVAAALENFRRASVAVRLAQLSAIFAVSDLADWCPSHTACIGWNGAGCAQANKAYWHDYISHGRETGRGTLFVPTLPSIPICEAAIALQIHGPTWYLSTAPDTELLFAALRDLCADMPEIRQVLICEVNQDSACTMLWIPKDKLPACRDLTELFLHCQNKLLP